MNYKLKRQRYWVLISEKGRPVLSSLIAREKRPRTGEWLEVNLTPCCTAKVEIADASTVNSVIVKSNGSKLSEFAVTELSIQAIADFLNSEYPAFGTFSEESGFLILKSTVGPGLSLETT